MQIDKTNEITQFIECINRCSIDVLLIIYHIFFLAKLSMHIKGYNNDKIQMMRLKYGSNLICVKLAFLLFLSEQKNRTISKNGKNILGLTKIL